MHIKEKSMKKILYLCFVLLIIYNPFLSAQQEVSKTDPILTGNIKIKDLKKMPYKKWFNDEYNSFRPDSNTISELSKVNKKFSVKVFLGTWCSDSRREVPRFLKIAEIAGIKKKKIEFIALDRKKTAPVYTENIYNIEYVPTFIFFRDNKEIGRIIETPQESLEKDMVRILEKKKRK